jgi:nitrogen regulatory protein P-II 1
MDEIEWSAAHTWSHAITGVDDAPTHSSPLSIAPSDRLALSEIDHRRTSCCPRRSTRHNSGPPNAKEVARDSSEATDSCWHSICGGRRICMDPLSVGCSEASRVCQRRHSRSSLERLRSARRTEVTVQFAKITAIIRCARLDEVETELRLAGIEGLTVSYVKGFGEYANFFRRDWTTTHGRLEIFVPRERAEHVAEIITNAARTGTPGDGVVAILPVERFYHIRNSGCGGDEPQAECRDQSEAV